MTFFILVIRPAGWDSCQKKQNKTQTSVNFKCLPKVEVHCTSSTVEALKNTYRKASTSNDHWDSNDTIKVYYPILLCSSTGHLHPPKITSTSIAQTITSQDWNNLLHFENNFLPHITIISRLCRFHLSYRRKNEKKGCLKYSNHCFFRRILLLLFFRDSRAANRRRRIPAVSRIKLKFTEHAQQNAPLLICRCFLAHTNGYSSYTHNRTCALPSAPPFRYVMAKIVPVVQLAVHAKSSTLYGRSYGRTSKFSRRDGLLLFCIVMGLRCARFASA